MAKKLVKKLIFDKIAAVQKKLRCEKNFILDGFGQIFLTDYSELKIRSYLGNYLPD